MSAPSVNRSLSLLVPLITTAMLPFTNNTLDSGLQLEEERGSPVRRFTSYGYTVAGVLLTFICIIGTFAHLCVILIIVKNPSLRTPVNWMLLNLSVSDLVISAFGAPMTAGASFAHDWIYGRNLCITYAFAMALTGVASITTLAVISIERYLLIAHPGRFTVTNRATLVAIIAVWAYSFVATFPPVVGWSSFQLESPGVACAPFWESRAPLDLSYEIYLLFLAFIFPVLAIFTCYGKMLSFLRNRIQHGAGQKVAKGQGRLTWMVVLMVFAFLVAWLPYAIVCIMIMTGGQHLVSATAAAVAPIFCKSSLIYNPIIYVLLNTQMRSAFVSLITCGRVVPSTSGGGKVLSTFGAKDVQTGAASANRSSAVEDHSSKVKKNESSVAVEEHSVHPPHSITYSPGIKKTSKS